MKHCKRIFILSFVLLTMFLCSCNSSSDSNLAYEVKRIVVDATCETEGYTTYECECGHTYNGDEKAATGHSFDGSVCAECGYDKADTCSCNCHKKGISNFFWKISNFFNKLFKNKNKRFCACGVAHY